MSNLAALSRNISWNYIDAAANLVIYILLTPVVVQQLGTTGFGIWVLINAILYYLRFLDLGFNNALIKYIAEYGERSAWRRVNSLIASTTSALVVAGAVALVLSVLVAIWIVPNFFRVPVERVGEFQIAVVLIGVHLLIGFPLSVLDAIYEGRQRFDVQSASSALCRVLSALAILFALTAGYGVIALVLVQIAATLLQATIQMMLMPRIVPQARLRLGRLSGPLQRRVRAFSGWSSLNELIVEGSSEMEKLLIPLLLSVSLVTPYTLVCTVAAAIFMAVEPITSTFFPLSAAYDAKSDRGRLRDLLLRGSKLVMAISLPLAVAIAVYGESFIDIWIGDEHGAIPAGVMPLVVSSFTVSAFAMTSGIILMARARVRELFWMTVAELALVVILALLLAPRAGLIGLAGSLLLANVVMTFFCTVPYLCRLLDQSLWRYLWGSLLRPLLAAIAAFLSTLILDRYFGTESLWALLLKCAIVGAVFVIVFWILALASAERRMVCDAVRQVWWRLRPPHDRSSVVVKSD